MSEKEDVILKIVNTNERINNIYCTGVEEIQNISTSHD
jgi:hypothetical protein